ncbi:hypothetical protein NGA_0376900 [Nannochloropsis gaditana CCMP526]|uniref:uncharacterized protein n=1 Tax=Nannochloropsis gaditana (strain CCMP526) TaxID=1093141 RepID=UPI00029F5C9D|nr:hypothetical protein NGA_0376900 [Nannochloropsis gaditana CCMP526]EKU21530.1 hypothetical protein NGA_0376900 [Nannochloropsis gaditana CCMP526]|eukprot:XP_005854828.1 hypothetical protein NGA_0376900 [Nannochloropsis gaditana CCMP526]
MSGPSGSRQPPQTLEETHIGGGKRRRGPMPEDPSGQLHMQEPGAQHVQQSQGLYRNATCPEYNWPRSSHDAGGGGGGGGKASDLTGRTVDGSHLGRLNMSGDHVLPHSMGREGRPNRSGGGEEYGWGSSTQESFPPPHPRHAGQAVGSTAETPSRGVGEGGRDEVELWRERRGDGVEGPPTTRSAPCSTHPPPSPPPTPPPSPALPRRSVALWAGWAARILTNFRPTIPSNNSSPPCLPTRV